MTLRQPVGDIENNGLGGASPASQDRATHEPSPDGLGHSVGVPDAGHAPFTVGGTAYLRNLHPDDTRSAIAIHYQRPPRETEGGMSIGLRFPLLIMASYVEDPEGVAEKIAAILNQHWVDAA